MGAVYLGGSTKLTSDNVKHRKIKCGQDVYYIARMPEGDFYWHVSYPTNKEGYGGDNIDFLLEDGTIETVKGPFGSSSFAHNMGNPESATGFPDIRTVATRLIVGRGLEPFDSEQKKEIVFEESTFVAGDWRDRFRPEWDGLEINVVGRSMTRILSPRDVSASLNERKKESAATVNS